MNDSFKEAKERLGRLRTLLLEGGGLANVEFAQALSRVERLVRKGDRSRAPSDEIRVTLDKAEMLGRTVRQGA